MIDEKEMRRNTLIKFYAQQQRMYLCGYRCVWGFGEHRMAEYILSPFRGLKP